MNYDTSEKNRELGIYGMIYIIEVLMQFIILILNTEKGSNLSRKEMYNATLRTYDSS